ncbi:hypothetical protein OA005_00205 [Paracoccaceae bacterium]|nr:hypothetical protein [Paracoccaceae bacterium]
MIVLILGSAPDVLDAKDFQKKKFDKIVAINNAWRVRDDWDYCIFPDDFPIKNRPREKDRKKIIRSKQYVPLQNKYGGFIYAGGTMAFTTGYWALGYLKPKKIIYIGCDMVYEGQSTHFYGRGTADPLRQDPTLKNLIAKSARLETLAENQNCSIFNLSKKPISNLIFRRIRIEDICLDIEPREIDRNLLRQVQIYEKDLHYFIADGKYWKHLDLIDQTEIDLLDKLWTKVVKS